MPDDLNNKMLAYLRENQQAMVDHLLSMIEVETPTYEKSAIDAFGKVIADEMRDLGAEVDIVPVETFGDCVRGRWKGDKKGVLILSHMDTVYDLGTVPQRPPVIKDGKLYGAGAMDMKGGIIVALWALRALRQFDALPDHQITYLFNADEEIGSPGSSWLIEEEALKHAAVFVTEPPENGAYKTARKGASGYRVTAIGRAAHAGAAHADGVNAIEELAHQILAIQAMTNYDIGTTANVGIVEGGTRSNVVPAKATATVNVRATTRANQQAIHDQIHSLTAKHPEAQVVVEGRIGVIPMERTPEIVALFKKAQAAAANMGIELNEASSGGGSDGNRTAAMGIPTLDGMGVVGYNAHSVDEYAEIDSLPERAAIFAAMLREAID